jgi:D-sedoheptulose 7-phosphate isomerase
MIFKDFTKSINEKILLDKKIIDLSDEVLLCIKKIYKTIKKSGKIFICGNGGSAADAQHLAAEFIVRLRPHINRGPIPAITLAQDTSTITACGNDYSFDDIFLRSFQALASKNDILVCISTSGNSKNILKVLNEAKKNNIYSICFLGKGGGKARKLCNKGLIVRSNNTARIQECHIFIGHFILEKVEDFLINNKSI